MDFSGFSLIFFFFAFIGFIRAVYLIYTKKSIEDPNYDKALIKFNDKGLIKLNGIIVLIRVFLWFTVTGKLQTDLKKLS